MVPSVKKASLKIKFVNKPLLILAYIVQFVDWIRRSMSRQIVVEDCPGWTTAWFFLGDSSVVDIRLRKPKSE